MLKQFIDYPFGKELSVLIGIQRAIKYHQNLPKVDVENAADFVAPSCISYLHFVIEQSKRLGIKRLYFLARDSYILYELSQMIPFNGIEYKFLYISRKSLYKTMLNELNLERICHIFGTPNLLGRTVKDLLSYLSIDFELDLAFTKITNHAEEILFVDALKKHSDYLVKRSFEEYKKVVRYFEQEGLLDDCPYAMVDVGWIGTTRLVINDILSNLTDYKPTTFYFALCKGCLGAKNGSFYSYNSESTQLPSITAIVEDYLLCSPLGSTVGYYTENGIIKPLLSDEKAYMDYEILLTDISIVKEVQRWIQELSYIDWEMAFSIWSVSFLKLFREHPSLIKLSTLSHFVKDGEIPIIKKLSIKETLEYLLQGIVNNVDLSELSFLYTYRIHLPVKYTFINLMKGIIRRVNNVLSTNHYVLKSNGTSKRKAKCVDSHRHL